MPAPEVAIVRVPFYYTPSADDDETRSRDATTQATSAAGNENFVTNVFIEVISFGDRFFWLHISEEAIGSAPRPPLSPLGCCATAVATVPAGATSTGFATVPPVSSTLWLDGENSVHGAGGGAGMDELQATTTTVQANFSTSLAQKLSRRVQRSTGKSCVIHVSCGVTGERAQSLLGTDSGGGFDVTAAFGTLVFRESFALVEKRVKGELKAC